ncbi:CapA family protein [Aurantibacter sp.]|uniref:CapA family protein n=1 Tax=Aurantibacter sp. TaxID=2807103 RepID=UPI0035C7F1BD
MKISFLGDISFNGNYKDIYKSGKFPFNELDFLKKSDYVIGNLECFSKGIGENELKSPRLNTSIETYNWLTNLNITHLGLANNHVYDNLSEGFEKSIKKLAELNIKFCGAGLLDEMESFLDIDKDGIKVRILNFVDKDTNPKLPEDCPLSLAFFEEEKLINSIQKHKVECDFLVLYIHWGGKSENLIYPEKKQIKQSERLLNSGVDLIVGHHSHTIQPSMNFNGKKVYYSLGNFCFSNIKLDDGSYYNLTKRNKEGLILTVDFSKEKLNITEEYFVEQNESGEIILNEALKNIYKKESKKFNTLVRLNKEFSNLPIYYNKIIKYPIQFLKRGSLKSQLKKINYAKIINYIKN